MTQQVQLAVRCLVLTAIAVAATGCNIIGYGARVLAGPPEVHAQYVLPQRPTVVWVKDQPTPMGDKVEADAVAAQVESQLKAFALAPTIDSTEVVQLQTSRPAEFSKMSPPQVANAVGAEQIIFVQINDSRVDMEGVNDMLRGRISASVSVYDVDGTLLWPNQVDNSSIISYTTPTMRMTDNVSRAGVERNLINELSVRVAALFRTYKPED